MLRTLRTRDEATARSAWHRHSAQRAAFLPDADNPKTGWYVVEYDDQRQDMRKQDNDETR